MADTTALSIETFGDLLKHLRQRARLTQDELGLAVGYSRAHITRLENGQRVPDSAAVKSRFIVALDLDDDPHTAAHLVALAQAVHGESVTQAEPPHRTPHNLPAQLSNFIGRSDELAEVQRLLLSTRLFTLMGAGGAGKTRLAIEVGAHLARQADYPDGVWLTRLEALADARLIIGAVAAAVGMPVTADVTLNGLIAYLRPRRLLLILDNSEHLIAACAELAEDLLRECPHLRIFATSREALNIAGELAWRIPSMNVSDAARLFAARARSAQHHFALTDENTPVVEDICRRLDGIPLALELAAARLRVLSVQQIAARLDDRFALLTDGTRTALPRHQTLRATIDWSYDLLTDAEQTLLRKLSVFAGGWMLEAAEAVCGASTLDGLQQLVNKSLVVADETPQGMRYRMLETIRQYGREKLTAAGELDETRKAHVAFFTSMLNQQLSTYDNTMDSRYLANIEAELDNVRAAVHCALHYGNGKSVYAIMEAAFSFWWFNGYMREGLANLSALLLRDDLSTNQRVMTWAGVTNLHTRMGHLAESIEAMQTAHRLACEANDADSIKYVEYNYPLTLASDLIHGTAGYIQELESIRKENDPRRLFNRLSDVAFMHRLQDNLVEAEQAFMECIAIARSQNLQFDLLYFLAEGSYVISDLRQQDRARTMVDEAFAIANRTGARVPAADATIALASVALRQHDYAVCESALRDALTIFRWVGNEDRKVQCIAIASGLKLAREYPEQAVQYLAAAEQAHQSLSPLLPYRSHWQYKSQLAALRAAVPPDVFERAWAEGKQMTLDQAVESVLSELSA